MAGKIPSKEEIASAVQTYIQKHPGVTSNYDEATDSHLMRDENQLEVILGPAMACTSAAVEEEIREIILEQRDACPQEPARGPVAEARKERAIMPMKPRNANAGPITPQDIINYINPKVTEAEAYLFAEFCRKKGADPMTKQVYVVVYEGQNGRQVNFIAGKEYFTEKAEAHPQFDGFEAGIIVQVGEADLEYREGTFTRKGETLLGGWANVYRKDRKIPSKAKVPLSEYNTGKNLWAKMPATMIRKVALVQSLREAFPANFGGMYDRAEMDQAMGGI